MLRQSSIKDSALINTRSAPFGSLPRRIWRKFNRVDPRLSELFTQQLHFAAQRLQAVYKGLLASFL